jgi:hypothetical protein
VDATGGSGAASRWAWAGVVLILLATTLVYSGSFDGDFVSDDLSAVRDNELLQELSWANLAGIFQAFDDSNYIPLKVLSLAVDRALFGHGVAGYHAMNLVYHLGCVLLVYTLWVRLRFSTWAACLATSIWALHPVQVESVAWISERKNVLSTLFLLGAFHLWIRYSRTRRHRALTLIYLLYGCALLCKMTTMVLPALCLAYEWTYAEKRPLRDQWPLLPMLFLGAVVAVVTLTGSPLPTVFHGGSATVTWLTSSTVVFAYLAKLILPVGLSPIYLVHLRGSLLDPAVLASVLALIAITAMSIRLLLLRRKAAFWIGWFFISLSPMLNIIPFPSLMQDRYLYVPLIGAVGVIAWVSQRLPVALRRGVAVISLALIVVYGVLSFRQVEVWSDATTHLVAVEKRVAFPIPDRAYREEGDTDYLRAVQAASERAPDSAVLLNNLARRLVIANRPDEALPLIRLALEKDDSIPEAWFNLGRLAMLARRPADAIDALERSRELDGQYFYTHLNLARVYLEQRQLTAARASLAMCERLRPTVASYWVAETSALARLEAELGQE